ncbi:MAG: response regulator transcription factor [Bryobacteraceae bacterium]|nr:response regulator transcription factor [Bryobacteraceae bacterium]
MRALIVDDERLARLELRRLLQSHTDVEITGEASDAAEALRLIGELSPDLLFLDIQMPGMTGFELLDCLQDYVPSVIFTTAYDKHALRAFEVNALDYLLKPIAPERLAASLRRIDTAFPQLRPSRVFVRDGDRCWIVEVSDIFLLESEGNYTRLHFGAERPLIRRSLCGLEQQLGEVMFFRANRKQILNLNWIERTYISISGGLTAVLRGGQIVEMSRRQSERLRAVLSL